MFRGRAASLRSSPIQNCLDMIADVVTELHIGRSVSGESCAFVEIALRHAEQFCDDLDAAVLTFAGGSQFFRET